MRWRKREATVGAPPRLRARLTIACGRAERGDEIVRGLADAPFRRRQAERGAHRAVEEGVGLGGRRPDGLVEPGDQREVEGEQPRFEQAEDLQARMRSARRRRALGRQHGVEQRRVIGERAAEAGVGFRRPVVEQRLQRFAAARVAPIAILGRQRGERGAMSGDEIGERRVGPERAQRRERRGAIGEQRRRGAPVGVGQAPARRMGVRARAAPRARRRAPPPDRRGRRAAGRCARRRSRAPAPRRRTPAPCGRGASAGRRTERRAGRARSRAPRPAPAARTRPPASRRAGGRRRVRPRSPSARVRRRRGARRRRRE